MTSEENVAYVRYVVQGILVPCLFVIGLMGNLISIYVLTRKRMRCTTNIYLTALAITDIIYLSIALMLSLQHNDYVKRNWKLYWAYYGLIMWLCDACAYISIYIAVCFTIERFIAIRYPLKRQTFCTEKLAKRVIAGVVVFCLLTTVVTAFEHTYVEITKGIDDYGQPCNITQTWQELDLEVNSSTNNINSLRGEVHIPNETIIEDFNDLNNSTRDCHKVNYYKHVPSSLAKNAIYIDVWYPFTLFVFVLIPLCLLGTFNCFLILLVKRSNSLRGEMTNANSMRRTRKGKVQSTASQENRVTVTLIAVVLLFIVCQLPWAIYLIVVENVDIEPNKQLIIGNILNFLAAIHAAANFFLYCVLSDKYRKTVREMIMGYKYRAQRSLHTHPSIYGSSLTTNSSQRRQHVSTSPILTIK